MISLYSLFWGLSRCFFASQRSGRLEARVCICLQKHICSSRITVRAQNVVADTCVSLMSAIQSWPYRSVGRCDHPSIYPCKTLPPPSFTVLCSSSPSCISPLSLNSPPPFIYFCRAQSLLCPNTVSSCVARARRSNYKLGENSQSLSHCLCNNPPITTPATSFNNLTFSIRISLYYLKKFVRQSYYSRRTMAEAAPGNISHLLSFTPLLRSKAKRANRFRHIV